MARSRCATTSRTRGPSRPTRDGLVAADPAAPTISRRGLLAFAGAGALTAAGRPTPAQSIGGPLRQLAFLAPRAASSARATSRSTRPPPRAGVTPAMTGPGYRLVLRAGDRRAASQPRRPARAAAAHGAAADRLRRGLDDHAGWTGVPLASLAERGRRGRAPASVLVESLQARGAFRAGDADARPVRRRRALLALKVNGADLSLDHGFPARIIVPGAPRRAQHEVGGSADLQGMSRFRDRYGASPLHLLAHLAAFALAGFALLQLVDLRAAGNVLVWFVGGRGAARLRPAAVLLGARPRGAGGRRSRAARSTTCGCPPGLSALLLLVFFPLILSRSTGKLEQVSGAPAPDYLARWLLISGVLCAGSAVLYLVRSRRVAAKLPAGGGERRPTGHPRTCRRRAGAAGSAFSGRARPGARAAPHRCEAGSSARRRRRADRGARARSPSSRRPARGRGRRRRRRERARARRRAASGVTCGVSMPTRSAGPPTSSNAAASRSASPSPRCAITSKPSGSQRAGLAVEGHDAPAPPSASARDRGQRVARAPPGQHGGLRGRARAGTGGSSTRPGHRRLGDHDAALALTASAAAHVAHGVAACRLHRARSPSSGPCAGGTRRRPRRSSSPPPPARSTISSGQPKRRSAKPSASSASRRRGAHRPEVAQRDAGAPPQLRRQHPVRRRARAAATPRARALRAPSTRSAPPGAHRVGHARQLARIERGVAVHEAHDLGCAPRAARRSTPRRSRAAARARPARRAPRRSSPEPSVEPLSTTSGVVARRHPLEHPRQRRRAR